MDVAGPDPYRDAPIASGPVEFLVHGRRRQTSAAHIGLLAFGVLSLLKPVFLSRDSPSAIWWLLGTLGIGGGLFAWTLVKRKCFLKVSAGPSGLRTHTVRMPEEKRIKLDAEEVLDVVPEVEDPKASPTSRRYRVTVLLEDDERTLIHGLEEPELARWIANSVAQGLGIRDDGGTQGVVIASSS